MKGKSREDKLEPLGKPPTGKSQRAGLWFDLRFQIEDQARPMESLLTVPKPEDWRSYARGQNLFAGKVGRAPGALPPPLHWKAGESWPERAKPQRVRQGWRTRWQGSKGPELFFRSSRINPPLLYLLLTSRSSTPARSNLGDRLEKCYF